MVELTETQVLSIATILIVAALALIVALAELRRAEAESHDYHRFIIDMMAELGKSFIKDARESSDFMDDFKDKGIDDLYLIKYGRYTEAMKAHDHLMEQMDKFIELRGGQK